MAIIPWLALCVSMLTLAWIEYQPHREARRRRKELLEKHPELRRHLR